MHEQSPSNNPNREQVQFLSYNNNKQMAQAKDISQLRINGEPVTPSQTPEEQAAERTGLITKAKSDVYLAHDKQESKSVVESLDFSPGKFSFFASNSYHAEARTSERNTTTSGKGAGQPGFAYSKNVGNHQEDLWGNPRQEAHYKKEPVERVGIRETKRIEYVETEKTVPAKGLRGKLGFKQTVKVQEPRFSEEPTYFFDYELATPSHGDEAARAVGNNTGQNIGLHIELTKEQAEGLSKIIEKDPAAARSVLDVFMAKTGNAETWNAKVFDEDGKFQDPATPYYNKTGFAKESGYKFGKDEITGGFLARDVRPNYDAMPSLKPEVVGTVGSKDVIGYLPTTPRTADDTLLVAAK